VPAAAAPHGREGGPCEEHPDGFETVRPEVEDDFNFVSFGSDEPIERPRDEAEESPLIVPWSVASAEAVAVEPEPAAPPLAAATTEGADRGAAAGEHALIAPRPTPDACAEPAGSPMMSPSQSRSSLSRELAALSGRFVELGEQLLSTASQLHTPGTPPA